MAINKTIETQTLKAEFEELEVKSPRRKWPAVLIIIIILAVLALAAYYFYFIPQSHKIYQAVFLTNGQVYFGKISNENSKYPVLREVFYLQVTQTVQPAEPGQTPPSNINLVKLGGELHGPTDEMRINRDQILFIEDLKSDSRVVQAIQQFQQTPK